VQDAKLFFSQGKAQTAGNTMCIAKGFHAVLRKKNEQIDKFLVLQTTGKEPFEVRLYGFRRAFILEDFYIDVQLLYRICTIVILKARFFIDVSFDSV
jgi:hypothetical protein